MHAAGYLLNLPWMLIIRASTNYNQLCWLILSWEIEIQKSDSIISDKPVNWYNSAAI